MRVSLDVGGREVLVTEDEARNIYSWLKTIFSPTKSKTVAESLSYGCLDARAGLDGIDPD